MSELGPNLQALLDEQNELVDPSIKGMIQDKDAVNSIIDGAAGVLLQKLAMATVVAATSAMQQGKHLDLSKIQQGRVKIVEGLLLIIEGEEDLLDFMDETDLFGGADVVEVLREFIAYNRTEPEPEAQVDE